MPENNEVNTTETFDVFEDQPTQASIGDNKLFIGSIGFAAGVAVCKVVIPGVKKLVEKIALKRRFKELNEEVYDESEVIINE